MKSLKTLEYDKVLSIVAEFADTEGAKQKLLQTIPSDDIVIVNRLLDETSEAFATVTVKSRPPFGRAKNILPQVERACKGAILSAGELLSVASAIRSAGAVKKYGARHDGTESALDVYYGAITPLPDLERAIFDAIIAEDIIADNASDKLLKLRRDIKRCENGVRDALSSFLTGSQSKYLQESIITQRGGRFVVPVKSEYRSQVSGIVHDTSASGSTVFIEPMAVLEANNKLRELKVAEQNEIEAILAGFSDRIAGSSDAIITGYNALTELAAIFARAYFAAEFRCTRPTVSAESQKLRLVKARHPLISKDTVVPISLEFGERERTMIITGPNTGGKTVTLKTIGLLSLMALSGLHIPADDGTCIPLFTQVLADIGDEQSIEQSLSTFSSHMTNIVDILSHCGKGSLVLFDELGAGTDPIEGAALAMAILETTKSAGALTAATTHYSELKVYALENDDVLNASCEFDVNTLKPTYRLITGLPGKSNAFAISLRLGLSSGIIERAREHMAEDNKKFEDVLSQLQESQQKLSAEREASQKARAEAEAALARAKKEAEEITEKARTELDRASTQAQKLLARAKAASDFVLNQLTELQRDKERSATKEQLEKARQDIRSRIGSTSRECGETDMPQSNYTPPRPFALGDEVTLADVNKQGIIKSISGDVATVQAGIIQVKTPLSNLRLHETAPQKGGKGSAVYERALSPFTPEIDVRGQTGDDAWFMIDSYLDDAMRSSFETVTVIHGKGTGALRNALWTYFKRDKRIASYRSGRYGEGETGVTVITLKK